MEFYAWYCRQADILRDRLKVCPSLEHLKAYLFVMNRLCQIELAYTTKIAIQDTP